MKNVQLNASALIKSKGMKKSFGCVNIFKDGDVFCAYKGCVYQNKNSFITLIQDFCFKDAERYEIEFSHLKAPLAVTSFDRDEKTGLTIFRMENEMCETLSPLAQAVIEIKVNDEVYLPLVSFGGEVTDFIAKKVVEIDGCYYIDGSLDVRELGLSLLNADGNIFGVVTSDCTLSEKELTELDLLVNSGPEVFQPSYKRDRTKAMMKSMATAHPLVPFPGFAI